MPPCHCRGSVRQAGRVGLALSRSEKLRVSAEINFSRMVLAAFKAPRSRMPYRITRSGLASSGKLSYSVIGDLRAAAHSAPSKRSPGRQAERWFDPNQKKSPVAFPLRRGLCLCGGDLLYDLAAVMGCKRRLGDLERSLQR